MFVQFVLVQLHCTMIDQLLVTLPLSLCLQLQTRSTPAPSCLQPLRLLTPFLPRLPHTRTPNPILLLSPKAQIPVPISRVQTQGLPFLPYTPPSTKLPFLLHRTIVPRPSPG